MTNVFMQNGAHAVPVVDPGPADGVFSLLWLVIALPLLGALVILVGGPLTKGRIGSWAHLLGCALPLVRLWPGSPVLAQRAEWALRLHGLP